MNKTKEAGIIKNINHKKAPPNNATPPKNTKTEISLPKFCFTYFSVKDNTLKSPSLLLFQNSRAKYQARAEHT